MASTFPDFSADLIAGLPGRTVIADDDRRFFRYLLIAVLLHALLLVRVHTGEPRRLGAPGGADDAISVSIITEKDLQGRATVEDRAAGKPVPPTPPVKPTEAPPEKPAEAPPIKPAEATPAQPALQMEDPTPQEAAKAATPPPPTVAALPEPAQTPETPSNLRPTLPDEAVDPAPQAAKPKPAPEKSETERPSEQKVKTEKSDEAAKPVEKPETAQIAKTAETPPDAKPKQQQKAPAKKTETAKLDLTPPAVFQAPIGGGGAGVQRPAGITRSGENDDFARGVIRALQMTMPQLRNTFGRVTVRIELDMKGNLVRTTVMKPSQVGGLDQSVVFATQQSSFPFPPVNAVPADLVFFVTYIYR